ncbi:wall-associated receptor kinase-like 8 [Euphorbia lathyris]|uniref:wall-associated receptor kinase-like 8 n=1 Tax=Euphorbia lathyris TaxID=212925 RepID=UPI003313CB7B
MRMRMGMGILVPLFVLVQVSALQSCQRECGNVEIQYPFGIGSNCSLNEWFKVSCDKSSTNRSRPLLSVINLEIMRISYGNSKIRVKTPIISSNCLGIHPGRPVNLTQTSFTIASSNKFTVVGCNSRALLTSAEPDIVGCAPTCDKNLRPEGRDPPCSGNICCQTSIPHFLQVFKPRFDDDDQKQDESCKLAFISDKKWLGSNVTSTSSIVGKWKYVPMSLDWKIDASLSNIGINKKTTRVGDIRYYNGYNFPYPNNTRLLCRQGYAGNPYLFHGCKDVDECMNPKIRSLCSGTCVNTLGSYTCQPSKSWIIISALSVGFGALSMVIIAWWLRRFIKKRKIIQQKKKFFKKNGGLLLQQHLCSDEKIKIFTSKELQRATDHFNDNRIIGQGGQGTVYKGMLADGRIVAVKKSIKLDEPKLNQFINEVVILSQIRHRNIVKLLGCCLETQVPILVYEFIPNGTLYDFLHYQTQDFQLSWKPRLDIAIQVSGALSYLHSAASIPIYHRDIKSRNILLDEKYRAKVSDFGVSRLISIDQTHLMTDVQGTFGYLDPEYFQSNRFTEKSDVYSFGVVLVELLTGQEPISTSKSGGCTGLAASFIVSMEQGKLDHLLDPRIIGNSCKDVEQVKAVANLAIRCLNLNGKLRPTMKEVTVELEGLRAILEDHKINLEKEDAEVGTEITTECLQTLAHSRPQVPKGKKTEATEGTEAAKPIKGKKRKAEEPKSPEPKSPKDVTKMPLKKKPTIRVKALTPHSLAVAVPEDSHFLKSQGMATEVTPISTSALGQQAPAVHSIPSTTDQHDEPIHTEEEPAQQNQSPPPQSSASIPSSSSKHKHHQSSREKRYAPFFTIYPPTQGFHDDNPFIDDGES